MRNIIFKSLLLISFEVTDILPACFYWIVQPRASPESRNEAICKIICASTNCSMVFFGSIYNEFSDHVFGYSLHCNTERNARNCMFNDQPVRWHGVMSCFQTNRSNDIVCSILMVSSVFGGIVEKARYQRSDNIITLAHYLE